MAIAGYRITEGGDSRILQNGDTRVSEGFQTGDASLTASSSYDFVATAKVGAAVAFVGDSSLVVSGNVISYGATLVANSSTMDAVGARKTGGETSLTASGTLAADEKLVAKGEFAGSAQGTFSPTGRVVKYVSVVSGNEQFLRILESEDYRVTESGDNRITNAIPTNEMVGSMVANDTYIPFSSTAYYKTGDVWKEAEVYTKNNGNWNALQAVYKKISGNWKRIH